MTLRLSEEGESIGAGGKAGDLYVIVHIKKHPKFNRKGHDLHTLKEISFPEAALGTKLEIETFDGIEKLRIPEGTQSGDIFKIPREGMPDVHERGYGDLYVEVHISTPKRLSRKAKKLLEELENELENNDRKY